MPPCSPSSHVFVVVLVSLTKCVCVFLSAYFWRQTCLIFYVPSDEIWAFCLCLAFGPSACLPLFAIVSVWTRKCMSGAWACVGLHFAGSPSVCLGVVAPSPLQASLKRTDRSTTVPPGQALQDPSRMGLGTVPSLSHPPPDGMGHGLYRASCSALVLRCSSPTPLTAPHSYAPPLCSAGTQPSPLRCLTLPLPCPLPPPIHT